MIIDVQDPASLIAAIRHAHNQCMIRYAQLSSCRVCGIQQEQFRQTTEQLKLLEQALGGAYVVPILEGKPGSSEQGTSRHAASSNAGNPTQ